VCRWGVGVGVGVGLWVWVKLCPLQQRNPPGLQGKDVAVPTWQEMGFMGAPTSISSQQ